MLSTPATICIYGGAAGGGKSFAMLMEPLRYTSVKGFNAVIFRSQFADIVKSGGLWEESEKMYGQIKGATPRIVDKQWVFRDKTGNVLSKVTFAYVNEQNFNTWKGSQIALLGFDELCDIPEKVFFFMLSRNRSTCGVEPYVRGTCNPDPDSWVAKFIEWWIDQETGYAIPERSGVIRWFVRRDEQIYWADTKEELWERFDLKTEEEKQEPRSATFIMSSVYDNKELLKVNPAYLGNLKAMAEVDRERFLRGNWKIRPAAGLYFNRIQVDILEEINPKDFQYVCRAWDLAATEQKDTNDPDSTAGVLMGKRKQDGLFVVLDVINRKVKAGDVEKLIQSTAVSDRATYKGMYKIRIPVDPGAAGKIVADNYVKKLAGFSVKAERVTGSKVARATPFASQWQNGNVAILAGEWNDAYFAQLEAFPEGSHDDMVDASSDAFNELVENTQFNVRNLL